MKSFVEFICRQPRPEHDSGLSFATFTHTGPLIFVLLGAVVALVALLILGIVRPQPRVIRNTYFFFTALPILWGITMTTLGQFRVLDQLERGGGNWTDGWVLLQPLQDVLSAHLVYLLTGSALTLIFLFLGLLLPRRQHEVA